jgi:hypothetical protein
VRAVVGGVQQHRDLLGRQRRRLAVGAGRWGGVLGGVTGDQPPGDRLLEAAVEAAVDGQDVLGGEPAWLPVSSPADGQLVIDALDLQWLQGLEELGAEVEADVMGQQGAVAFDRPGPKGGLDVGQPAVQVLVDGKLGRVEGDALAAAGQRVSQGGLGLATRGIAAQGLKAAGVVGAAGQLEPGVPADAAA